MCCESHQGSPKEEKRSSKSDSFLRPRIASSTPGPSVLPQLLLHFHCVRGESSAPASPSGSQAPFVLCERGVFGKLDGNLILSPYCCTIQKMAFNFSSRDKPLLSDMSFIQGGKMQSLFLRSPGCSWDINWVERPRSKPGGGHRLPGGTVWKPRGGASSDWGSDTSLETNIRILKGE